jgi:hypothetical protein
VNHLVKSNTYNNLYLTGSGAKTLDGATTVSATATADAASLAISTYKLTVTNSTTAPFVSANSGTFSFGSGEVDYNGTAQSVFNTTYGTLTVSNSGTKTMAGDVAASTALNLSAGTLSIGAGFTLTAGGTMTNTGTLTGSTTSHLVINGTGTVDLPQITGSNLGDLTFNRTGLNDSLRMASNITVNGTLTATAGTLQVNDHTLELVGTVAGTSGGFASRALGTVYYNGAGGQAVLAASYGNLTFNNTAKDLTSATVSVGNAFTPGTSTAHTITGSTIVFNGGSQNIPQFNGTIVGYNNLTTSGSLSTKTIAADIRVAGAFTNGSSVTTNVGSHTLTLIGARSQGNDAATMQFAANNGLFFTTGTVDYNGTDQNIAGDVDPVNNYYKILLLSNGGTKTVLAGATNIVRTLGNLTINGGVGLNVVATGDLRVEGDLANAGTITNAGSITVGL